MQLEEAGTDNSRQPSARIVIGGLYATRCKDGYTIVKVLAVEDSIVHLRGYADRFDKLPERISSSELSLGALSETGPFGIGHFPIARQGFDLKTHVLVGHETVCDDELDGYRIWKGIHAP